jgi:hypothetical protein
MSNYNEFTNQNYNSNINQNMDNNFMNNISNEKFINMASSIDLETLNGTNIMDLNKESGSVSIPNLTSQNNIPMFNTTSFNTLPINNSNLINNTLPINNMQHFNNIPNFNLSLQNDLQSGLANGTQDKHLVKSITKELINNLRENNISLHDDNETYNSGYSKKSKNINNADSLNDYENIDDYDDSSLQSENTLNHKKSKKKYEYKDQLKKGFEHMMTENGVPSSQSLSSYIFDDLFNFKEFIILFGIYFLLSQEMVKDLFAQYFTSLNPDDSGRVHVKGVIIYGLILTVLFMILKKIV